MSLLAANRFPVDIFAMVESERTPHMKTFLNTAETLFLDEAGQMFRDGFPRLIVGVLICRVDGQYKRGGTAEGIRCGVEHGRCLNGGRFLLRYRQRDICQNRDEYESNGRNSPGAHPGEELPESPDIAQPQHVDESRYTHQEA